MKKYFYSLPAAAVWACSGCAVAGGIFKAGEWTGILSVAVIIAAIIAIIAFFRRK